MRSHSWPPARTLLIAAWLGVLGLGCRNSQVWFGRAAGPVQTNQAGRAAQGGSDAALPAPGDAGLDAGGAAGAEAGPLEPMPQAGAAGAAAGSGMDPVSPAANGGGVGGANAGAAGSRPVSGSPRLPSPTGVCPQIASGEVMFAGLTTRMWVGTRMPGQSAPLLIYWHGTGSSPAEVESFYGQQLDQILAQGGVVAALAESSGYGQDVGTGTWSTGDASIADEIVACTVQQRSIDPRRIYTAGCSSGGLMAGGTLYLRSSYIAAAMLDSGGSVLSLELEDPTHVPAVIASHGSASTDIVIVNFATLSEDFTMQVAGRGGFAVVCDHGGGHCGSPPAIRAAQWRFLSDHPYGTGPSPYANGLPPEFPEECRIATPR